MEAMSKKKIQKNRQKNRQKKTMKMIQRPKMRNQKNSKKNLKKSKCLKDSQWRKNPILQKKETQVIEISESDFDDETEKIPEKIEKLPIKKESHSSNSIEIIEIGKKEKDDSKILKEKLEKLEKLAMEKESSSSNSIETIEIGKKEKDDSKMLNEKTDKTEKTDKPEKK